MKNFLLNLTRTSFAALSLLAFSNIASGADLGGNCCADLEERVAELEATVAKKGERKLSMTISGQVSAAIVHYQFDVDDWSSSDTFVATGQGTPNRLQLDGRAQINENWEGGYRFSMTWSGVNGGNYSPFERPTSNELKTREAYFFLRNKQLGAVSIGTRDAVIQSAGKVDISGALGTQGNLDPTNQMGILGALASQSDGDGGASQRAGVRYDSPSVAGFILSADWTNVNSALDAWAIRLSGGGQFGDFKVAAAAGYEAQQSVLGNTLNAPAGVVPEAKRMVASGGIMHVPSGIFINASWGETDTGILGDANSSHWGVQAGIQTKPFKMGKTTIYGAWYHSEDNSLIIGGPLGIPVYIGGEYEVEYWGGGIVQDIDAANMSLYAGYRNYGSDDCQAQLDVNCDLDVFMVGGIVKF